MSGLAAQERERLEARRAPEAGISVYCGALRRRERLQAMVDELPPEQVVVMAESGWKMHPLFGAVRAEQRAVIQAAQALDAWSTAAPERQPTALDRLIDHAEETAWANILADLGMEPER